MFTLSPPESNGEEAAKKPKIEEMEANDEVRFTECISSPKMLAISKVPI